MSNKLTVLLLIHLSGNEMKIGNRWSAKLEEVSSGHYRCRAVEGDEVELDNRIRVDAYLDDSMVLNKLLLRSLRGRNASQSSDVFLGGYNSLDDTDAGWHAFLTSLTTLKSMRTDLTFEELRAVEEPHESLVSVFPLLLQGVATQQAEQADAHNRRPAGA